MHKIDFKDSNKNYSILIGSNIYSILSSKIKSLCPRTKKVALIFDKGLPHSYKSKIIKVDTKEKRADVLPGKASDDCQKWEGDWRFWDCSPRSFEGV